MLSFLGAVESIRKQYAPKVALALFVCGLIFVGIHMALWIHHIERMFKALQTNTSRFFAGGMEFRALTDMDDALARKTSLLYITGYTSFVCFIAGSVAALLYTSF
jgi:hypothetical protein